MNRKITKTIKVGNVTIGGGDRISVQSMLNTKTTDVNACVGQINRLKDAGCDIVRLTVMDKESVNSFAKIKEMTDMPLVADIHFDYKLAVDVAYAGADKIRINPGNIGSDDGVKAVVDACRANNIPIRIGVNGGSLEKHILAKYGHPTPKALVESAKYHIDLLHKYDFDSFAVSMKSSDVTTCVDAYRLISSQYDCPLHIGITETGHRDMGIVKSAVGLGTLLLEGIGDTMRVSLTDDPVNEVKTAYDILSAAGIYKDRPEIISCPTCGRTQIDLIGLVEQVNELVKNIDKPIKIAVMGCVVNGPGEAREADIGIAGGRNEGLLFRHGEIIKKVPAKELLSELSKEIDKFILEK